MRVLQQPQTIDQTRKLVKTVFKDDSVKDTTKVFFLDLLAIQQVWLGMHQYRDRDHRAGIL